MGLPLHFNTVSSTDGYYGVLLWLRGGRSLSLPSTNPPTFLTHSCILDLEAGVGWFGVFLEVLGAFSEAELVGVE